MAAQAMFGIRRWAALLAAAACLTSVWIGPAERTANAQYCDSGACGGPDNCAGCRAFLSQCAPTLDGGPTPYVVPGAEYEAGPGFDTALNGDTSIPFADNLSPNANALPESGMSPAVPALGSLAASLGTSAGSSGVPDMIGDFFAVGYNYGFVGPGATVAVAGGDRRVKFAENNSPFPRNRIFFNYNHFHNALTDANGDAASLNRYTFGLERAFWDGLLSAEVRVPFAGTISSNPVLGSDPTATEFGNVTLAFKALLLEDSASALSAGLAVVLPTGADFSIQGDIVDNLFRNEAVHLQPFVGMYYAPRPRLFTMMFTQLDFDTRGNDVAIAGISDRLRDQTLLFLDGSLGYWLHRNPSAPLVRSVAPMVELHYTTTLENQRYGAFENVRLNSGGSTIFVQDARRDVLNLTGGMFFELGSLSTLKIGAVVPLRTTGSDKLFDTELGLQFTRRY